MPAIEFDGQRRYVPGVYTRTRVASSLPGALPAFQIPIVLGYGFDGHPYDADSKLVTGESPLTPFKYVGTDTAAAAYFGPQTDIHRAMVWGKRHQLPFAYVVNLSDMTRASIIVDAAGTEQFTLHARKFGPMGGWTKVQFASNTLTITPVKRYAPIAANVGSSATRVYLKGLHSWAVEGASITIGSNAVAGLARTIAKAGIEINASGQKEQWLELSSAPGSAVNTADYGVILQYDDAAAYSYVGITTSQAAIDAVNDLDETFIAVKHANFDNTVPDAVATAAPLKEISAWGTATVGTAPAATDTDLQAFIALMNGGEWNAFLYREQVIPQAYLLATPNATMHATMRDYASAERQRGYGISVTVGGDWGDVVIGAGDSTDPTFRSAALNSQDVMLCAGGLDREAAYLSLAPAVFGRRVRGGPNHNLTNDELVASEREVEWNEIDDGEESTLSKKGVCTYKLSVASAGFRYRVSQGLSTLQANLGAIWNTDDATTWSTMQRDLADFVDRVVRTDFEEQIIGADRVDGNAIAAVLQRRAEKSLEARGHLKSGGFLVEAIALNSAGNGYDVEWSVRLPDTVDYMTFTTTILIGEA